jgi:PadR family transcriptional regulator, regulatory protein PadR
MREQLHHAKALDGAVSWELAPHNAILRRSSMNAKSQIYRSFLHGMVKLFVLQQAGQGPVYGGALSKSLHTLGYEISPGSLYPLLHSLTQEKLLRCHIQMVKGRMRKYYELTEGGRSCLTAVREELAGLVKEVVFAGKPCGPEC